MGKEGKVRRKLEITRKRAKQKMKRLKCRLKCLSWEGGKRK